MASEKILPLCEFKLPLFSGNDDTDCTVLNTHFILKGASTDTDTNTR